MYKEIIDNLLDKVNKSSQKFDIELNYGPKV